MDNSVPGAPPPGSSGIQGPAGPQKSDDASPANPNDPFAKMFAMAGHPLTQKELKAIINQFVKDIINRIKKDDEEWKKAMDHMKKVIEGKE